MPLIPDRSEVIRCLHEVSDHRCNLSSLVSLLECCGENREMLEARVVREASNLLWDELEKMKGWLERLAELTRSQEGK